MLELKNGVITLNGEPLSFIDALLYIVDLLSESASVETPLSEADLKKINGIVDATHPSISDLEPDDIQKILLACCNGLTQGTHTSSGFALARVLFSVGEVARQQGDFRAINALVTFCSDTLFALYLHEPVYYRYITYAFYSICKGHERIEDMGYFDTIKYVERKRGYNGMEIDFIDMTAYYARSGIKSKQTPLGLHEYYKMLIKAHDSFRAITDGIAGRYTEGGAVSLYDYCMTKIPVEGNLGNPYIWAGLAYMVSLHMGAYKKRLRIARLYHAAKLCKPTDLDHEERKWAVKRLFAILSILSTVAIGVMKVVNFHALNPFRFYLAAGFAAFIGLFMLLSLFGNRGNGRFMVFFNPWSGWSHGIGYFQ